LWIAPFYLYAADGPKPLRQQVDEVYRMSEEMVRHGMHGHGAEIVQHGKAIRARALPLQDGVQALPKLKREAALASLNRALREIDAAIAQGEKKRLHFSLAAARQALFHLKQLRQNIRP